MKLLAIDTSSNACSVALQTEDGISDRHVVEPRAHTKILIPMISELLADAGQALSDLDAIVLGNGPGSFIGMRIGASVVQGLCFGADIPVVPVSSLAAIAAEAFDTNDENFVVVAQDARMNEIYHGAFRRGNEDLPELIGDESIIAVGELPLGNSSYAAAGAAWQHYPDLVAANSQNITTKLPLAFPRASYLLKIGRQMIVDGKSMPAESLVPAYLRMKVAEKPSPAQ